MANAVRRTGAPLSRPFTRLDVFAALVAFIKLIPDDKNLRHTLKWFHRAHGLKSYRVGLQ
jgi:hypothetical protein